MDIPSFAGEWGGTIAAAFGSGCLTGWRYCVRTLVDPERTKAATLQAKLDEWESKAKDEFWAGVAKSKGGLD